MSQDTEGDLVRAATALLNDATPLGMNPASDHVVSYKLIERLRKALDTHVLEGDR